MYLEKVIFYKLKVLNLHRMAQSSDLSIRMKQKEKQKVTRLMDSLDSSVEECVGGLFSLCRTGVDQIGFYQLVAGRLINVTVELQSALSQVNNMIDKINKGQINNTVQQNNNLSQQVNVSIKQPVSNDLKQSITQQKRKKSVQQLNIPIMRSSDYIVPFHQTSVQTQQEMQSMSMANDNLYRQYCQLIAKYHHDKHSLNHQNQILLNQWLENTSTHPSPIQSNTHLTLIKSLIQQLSKYQSVSQYIANIQAIQHSKVIHELKHTYPLNSDDQQKKWLKDITKSYLLNMAQLLHNNESEHIDFVLSLDQDYDTI